MKKLLPILSLALLLAACDGVREEVQSTFPDGSPELVYLVKGKGEKQLRVGERRYYSNHQMQSEIHVAKDGSTPSGTWRFFYPDGTRFASWETQSGAWSFSPGEGGANSFLSEVYDSIATARFSIGNLPLEVCAYRGDTVLLFQFFEDFSLQCRGALVGGLKEGLWTHFYPATGATLSEATFVHGVENGPYRSFRENGIPYFLGQYTDGQRSGVWEFYDPQGELSGRKNYDE